VAVAAEAVDEAQPGALLPEAEREAPVVAADVAAAVDAAPLTKSAPAW
jgi:hypothetical protein